MIQMGAAKEIDRDLLCGDTATSRKHVQRHPFTQEQMSRFASDSSDMLDRLKGVALFDMPFHSIRIVVNESMWGSRKKD